MRKLNTREWFMIRTALRAQKDMCVEQITEAERQGRRLISTKEYVEREHDELIEKLKESVTKKALKDDI